ncbi:MAG: primosomal protein N' [Proteobacteria bacterium]|nr:primosomal protein N' [Pseudomonadota bacterium]
MIEHVAEVAVTLPVFGRYHYRIPPHLAARAVIGARVLVRFGARKVTGVVVALDTPTPAGVKVVDLSEVLDDEPSLSKELVELCTWIAEYYEAPPGEAFKAALPAGSGVVEKQVVTLTEAGRISIAGEGGALPAKQRAVLVRLGAGDLPVAGMPPATRRLVTALETSGLVMMSDRRRAARAKLATERVVELLVGGDVVIAAFARPGKRVAVVEALARGAVRAEALETAVPGSKAIVRELAKLGHVRTFERERSIGIAHVEGVGEASTPPPTLTSEQVIAVDAIVAALGAPAWKPFLLHGVTGSGKTEVYLRVIAEALDRGKTALVLVPEISLTPQLAARFRARFGDRVAILHSGLSEQARLGEWSRLRRGEASIAVGARSAVFAPLVDLGVIVVDEEHDGSFKQDEGVKYHGRDVAIVRAQRTRAVCVLGSATPSLESYAHTEQGTYHRLVLAQRPTARPMPHVDIIDLRTFIPDGEAMLSAPLREAIGQTLAAGDQSILFLNRRGYATFVLCMACGTAFRCPHCSVSLTYHHASDRLSCHYCGYTQRVPDACPKCGAQAIERKGLGTEKVAAAVAAAFPTARVARLDRDVASGAKAEVVLSKVGRREVDILVGTQMVTKGHDFPGVTLVGVLCADTGLTLPDFRASERTFQLLAQVAGRAGRGDRPGRVIIQTYRPDATAVTAAAAHDYTKFFVAEIADRDELTYPPHGRQIAVRIDGPDEHEVAGVAKKLADIAEDMIASRPELANVILRGPVAAPLSRLRNRTRWQIWLRGTDRTALRRIARALAAVLVTPSVRVALDVDPISAM